jgi:hypothetical protein
MRLKKKRTSTKARQKYLGYNEDNVSMFEMDLVDIFTSARSEIMSINKAMMKLVQLLESEFKNKPWDMTKRPLHLLSKTLYSMGHLRYQKIIHFSCADAQGIACMAQTLEDLTLLGLTHELCQLLNIASKQNTTSVRRETLKSIEMAVSDSRGYLKRVHLTENDVEILKGKFYDASLKIEVKTEPNEFVSTLPKELQKVASERTDNLHIIRGSDGVLQVYNLCGELKPHQFKSFTEKIRVFRYPWSAYYLNVNEALFSWRRFGRKRRIMINKADSQMLDIVFKLIG